MKAHIFRELVNDLRDIATQWHGSQQLRERISRRLLSIDEDPANNNPWKLAVIDQLVIAHILTAEHETDPLKAVQDLLAYHADIAVDPRISGAASDLVEKAREEEKGRRRELASAFQEYLYRTSAQVPFEHAEWAQQRGSALLDALKA